MTLTAHPIYAGSGLDRSEPRRKDTEWIAVQRGQNALTVALWREQFLMRQSPAAIAGYDGAKEDFPWVFLGVSPTGQPVFAIDLSRLEEPPAQPGCVFISVRSVWRDLPPEDAAIVAHARGMLGWQAKHGFCGRCGGVCLPIQAGHAMECTSCRAHHFPRTDPAVIMLVTHGAKALLARHQRVGTAMTYSVLAGFVEPGETLEEAVAREVLEESGLTVASVAYHSSQPWPFPSSLMLGFTAEARDTDLVLDSSELQDARWFTRDELRAPDGFNLPSADSIAHRLIADWIGQR